ncbi:MAG: radical SAM protein, partial [Promethearchaeota archaeon]
MNNNEDLISKIQRNEASWRDFSEFIKIQDELVDPFLEIALEKKRKYFGDLVKVYVPNDRYPAISITGDYCELNCEHCNKKYLRGMKGLTTNDKLYEYLKNHDKKGGVGALISGGCLKDGSVPLLDFLDTIKKIKKETDLIINIHTGLLNDLTAKKLVEAQVDIISFDINIDPEIIQNIYHLNKKPEDYKEAVKIFQRYNLNVIPHICVGLHYGNISKELDCIRFIKKIGLDPSIIVLIALIPPKNSKKKFKTPSKYDIA